MNNEGLFVLRLKYICYKIEAFLYFFMIVKLVNLFINRIQFHVLAYCDIFFQPFSVSFKSDVFIFCYTLTYSTQDTYLYV